MPKRTGEDAGKVEQATAAAVLIRRLLPSREVEVSPDTPLNAAGGSK